MVYLQGNHMIVLGFPYIEKTTFPEETTNMESPTLHDLLKQYELSNRSCKKPVSDVHLELFSRAHCKQWKSLPSHIGLETIIAEDINRSQKDEREKRQDFFIQWKETQGSRATYKLLITALLKIGCRQDAEKMCEMLKESICPQPRLLPAQPDTACALPPPKTTGNYSKLLYEGNFIFSWFSWFGP